VIKCPNCEHQFDVLTPPKPNAKPCPNCREFGIVELPSMNKKICFSCHSEFDWYLKPNQKSVLIHGLKGES